MHNKKVCKEEGPCGAFPGQPSTPPHPLLYLLSVVSHAYFLSFSFVENHRQKEEINYLMLISTKPPGLLVTKGRSPPPNQRMVYKLITRPPGCPSLTRPLKMLS